MQQNFATDEQYFNKDGYEGYGSQGGYTGFGGYLNEAPPKKGVWVSLPKRKLNYVPMLVCLLVPFALFVVVYSLLAFKLHYAHPHITELIILALVVGVVAVCLKAANGRFRLFRGPMGDREPSWLIFFALSMILAFALGYVEGQANYSANNQNFYDLMNLNNYTNVFPNRMSGAQLIDAGIIDFVPGSVVDVKKSMGFKNQNMYCVAPITFGTGTETYDFWAIGTNCCSGYQADFHCRNYNNPEANGGIRMLDSSERAFFRLAVQQAEATYNIKASHPLFFTWEMNPTAEVKSWEAKGWSAFRVWVISYFVLQFVLVLVACLIFSKLGNL
mmetsp:Transcript_9618/g.17264  ORF Transcript_9618/g.17264 Transcript_9618/m.17264 type:complete len:330 (-) Transcript_9618:32-1021(-)